MQTIGAKQQLGLLLLAAGWLLACWSPRAGAFNLSPWPTIELRPPSDVRGNRSAYFGFTINLRSRSILIGAPRSQSRLPDQLALTEPGTIYWADLNAGGGRLGRQPPCQPFVFEGGGNRAATENADRYDGELRDNQWLGAAMDGGPSETQPLAVCAPRMHTHVETETGQLAELNPGICYWTAQSVTGQPLSVTAINELNRIDERADDTTYKQQLAELGFSMHMIRNDSTPASAAPTILMGAPGVWNWRGAVLLYWKVNRSAGPSTARRRRRRAARSRMSKKLSAPSESMGVEEGAYFGYAVSSAPHFATAERERGLAYVASAPRMGVVYTFGLRPNGDMVPYANVSGDQLGEYFGYSLAVDDFDGDGLSDLAVGAPLHSRADSGDGAFDSGAVYVYSGAVGRWQFRRRLQAPPATGSPGGGRFGTTLALLGDLNGDGLADLAVGAPFEADGVVYVYLGMPQGGLRALPSQRLEAAARFHGGAWFGHGLSRGVDVDGNGWRDVAVGAPNADTVYVYQSYPVVVLEVAIEPSAPAIAIEASQVEFRVCWRAQGRDVRLVIDVELDRGFNRLGNGTAIRLSEMAQAARQCREFTRPVAFKQENVYDAIVLGAHFTVLNDWLAKETEHRQLGTFCDDCVAVDPQAPTRNTSTVIFSTNCKEAVCVADLRVSSAVVDHKAPFTYVVGSKSALAINYLVRNDGENAFLPRLFVRVPDNIFFAVIPTNCQLETKPVQQLNCELSGTAAKMPLGPNGTTVQTIHLDTAQLVETQLRGQQPVLQLEARTAYGADRQLSEPQRMHIALAENSVLQVAGIPSVADVSLEDGLRQLTIVHPLKVLNSGPSRLHEADIEVLVPLVYADGVGRWQVLDWQQIEINCTFKGERIAPVWYRNDTRLLPGQPFEGPGQPIEAPKLYSLDVLGLQLLPGRTILFNCHNASVQCAQVRFAVRDFRVDDQPVSIQMRMQLDLAIINEIVDDIRDTFVLQTLVRVRRHGESHFGNRTVQVEAKFPFTEIHKYTARPVPTWVYVLSALGGLAILVGMTYGMHRAGFFQRAQRAQMLQQQEPEANGMLTRDRFPEEGEEANSGGGSESTEACEDEMRPMNV